MFVNNLQAGGVTFVTLTDTADTVIRQRMLTVAKSSINQSQHSPCVGATADWLSAGGENPPLLRHHRFAVAREILAAVVDRVLSEVGEDDHNASDDVQKVRSNLERDDNYIAALKQLAI